MSYLEIDRWILAQSRIVTGALRDLATLLRRDIDDHRRQFRAVSLCTIFREGDVPHRARAAFDARFIDSTAAKDLRAAVGRVINELIRRGLRSDSYNVDAYRDVLRVSAGNLTADRAAELRTRLAEFELIIADIDRSYRRGWRPR
ncbi:MAG TPA: hypothetical protein VJ787_10210 [Thermoleophilia bacterium]|nr:hypothetical protein [Thermoleophilia bacterium]